MLVAGMDGAIRLIDSETGQVQTLPDRHNSALRGAAISPQGTHFVSASFGDLVRVWDMDTLKPVWTLDKPDSYVGTAFHPDGDLIAVNAAVVLSNRTAERESCLARNSITSHDSLTLV